ncbi:MAG: hypothetical protein ACRCYC_02880 [Paraclostridium sp.]|uniref:hypothetical protein n=1 Tax=Paraclostridium sp. TaxID=2023273 RepID=UPI003F333C2C
MKRILLILTLILTMITFTIACSKDVVENKKEDIKIIPTGLSDEMGEGNITVTTPTSSSEGGTIPIIHIDEYRGLSQLGLKSDGFYNSKPSYIYIDGKLNAIEKLGELNSLTLTICEEDLSEGIHKIEVVQFENDKTSGTPVIYKNCKYEIKKK